MSMSTHVTYMCVSDAPRGAFVFVQVIEPGYVNVCVSVLIHPHTAVQYIASYVCLSVLIHLHTALQYIASYVCLSVLLHLHTALQYIASYVCLCMNVCMSTPLN